MERWRPGEVIVRRERLGLQPAAVRSPSPSEGVWHGVPDHVVEDTQDQLVTFTGPAAEFGFVDGQWPTEDGRHPYHGRDSWTGEGCLMVQRPGDHYAVWHFWLGEDRTFLCWYLNLQTDIVRHSIGYDTQDLDLDIIVWPDGRWELKDDEILEQRVEDGRFSDELVQWIRAYGDHLTGRLDREGPWWDLRWAEWRPPAKWRDASLPPGWCGR